jgi:hypothetical protein
MIPREFGNLIMGYDIRSTIESGAEQKVDDVNENNTKKNPKLVAVELKNHAANLIHVVINWKVKEK